MKECSIIETAGHVEWRVASAERSAMERGLVQDGETIKKKLRLTSFPGMYDLRLSDHVTYAILLATHDRLVIVKESGAGSGPCASNMLRIAIDYTLLPRLSHARSLSSLNSPRHRCQQSPQQALPGARFAHARVSKSNIKRPSSVRASAPTSGWVAAAAPRCCLAQASPSQEEVG